MYYMESRSSSGVGVRYNLSDIEEGSSVLTVLSDSAGPRGRGREREVCVMRDDGGKNRWGVRVGGRLGRDT